MARCDNEILGRLFEDIAQELLFMFADPVEADDDLAVDGPAILASMDLAAPEPAHLWLAVPLEAGIEMAVNMLGVRAPDELEPGMATDVIGELLNILCGHLITALAGPDAEVRATLPVLQELEAEAWAALRDRPERLPMRVDGHLVLLGCTLGAPA